MSDQNKISKKGANRKQEKPKLAEAKKPKASSKKSQEITIAQAIIKVGNTEYDVTNKKRDELPDELKAALKPMQELYAKLLVDGAWRSFYNNMPPELRANFDALSKSQQHELFSKWCEVNLLNENK